MQELPQGAPVPEGYIEIPMLRRRPGLPQATVDDAAGVVHIPCISLADLGLKPGRDIPRAAPPTAADLQARMADQAAPLSRINPTGELAALVAGAADRLTPEERERFIALGVYMMRCMQPRPPLLRNLAEIEAWTAGAPQPRRRGTPVLGEIGD